MGEGVRPTRVATDARPLSLPSPSRERELIDTAYVGIRTFISERNEAAFIGLDLGEVQRDVLV